MYSISIRALLISSQPGVKEMVEGCLSTLQAPCTVQACADLDSACGWDNSSVDVILLDGGNPATAISELKISFRDCPIIYLTEKQDHTAGLAAIRQGASDYMSREEMSPTNLFRTLRYAVERAKVEAALETARGQLYQTQKMEAIGRLASVLAHDFKQFIQVILASCSLLRAQLQERPELLESLGDIKSAGLNANDLIEQLLNFASDREARALVVDLNRVVGDNQKILRPLLKPGQTLQSRLSPTPQWVRIDTNQAGQVLMNLGVNAVDAMVSGGTLEIKTRSLFLERPYQGADLVLSPGNYCLLEVSDNGHGIQEDILDKIFEPFFTSRSGQRGTGLGLSTVYNLVESWGGSVGVATHPGRGTTFKIAIPLAVAPEPEATRPLAPSCVTLLESDPGRRLTLRQSLSEIGCEVQEVTSLEQAQEAANQGQIVLATDHEHGWEQLSNHRGFILLSGLSPSLHPTPHTTVLPTPFDTTQLRNTLSQKIGGKQAYASV